MSSLAVTQRSSERICAGCNKSNLQVSETEQKTEQVFKRCGGCKSVFYCDKHCQRVDWTKHREVCGRLKGNASKTGTEEKVQSSVSSILTGKEASLTQLRSLYWSNFARFLLVHFQGKTSELSEREKGIFSCTLGKKFLHGNYQINDRYREEFLQMRLNGRFKFFQEKEVKDAINACDKNVVCFGVGMGMEVLALLGKHSLIPECKKNIRRIQLIDFEIVFTHTKNFLSFVEQGFEEQDQFQNKLDFLPVESRSPLGRNSSSLIFSSETFLHMSKEEVRKILQEFHQALDPRGVLCVSVVTPKDTKPESKKDNCIFESLEQAFNFFEEQQFKIEGVTELSPKKLYKDYMLCMRKAVE